MIDTNYRQIVNSLGPLSQLANASIPGRDILLFARMYNAVQKEGDTFKEVNNKIIQDLGTEQKNKTFKVMPDQMPEFNKQMAAMLNTEVILPQKRLPVSALDGINVKKQDITAKDMASLLYLFEEEEAPTSKNTKE